MTGIPGPQTIESIVAFWICTPLAALSGLVTAYFVLAAVASEPKTSSYEIGFGRLGYSVSAAGMLIVTGLFIGGYIWGMYPDDFAHHHYQRYSGVVATTNSRILGDGNGGADQKFVVTFTAAPNEPFGVLDTRAAVVRPGQTLTIDCVQQWQYAGTDGQDCAFVSVS